MSGQRHEGSSQLVAGEQTKGWGSYFVDLNFASESLVEVPHPVFDTNSWYVGARAFQESRASEFLMAGAHRNANGIGTADVAHLNESIFQEVHQAWNGVAGETTPWQMHGFSLAKHPSFPAGTDAVLSNGDGGVTTDVIGLDGTLDGAGFLSHVYNILPAGDLTNIEVNGGVDGSTFSSLGATSNVQGLHSRGLGGEFVHIELAQSIRFNMENIDTASMLIAKSIAVPEPSCLALYVVGIAFLCLKTPSQEVKYCGRFF